MDIVLMKPFSLQNESDAESDYKVPNLSKRLSTLARTLRPGSDTTNMQLPPIFNLPKSQLQCYGEVLYSTASDILSRCNAGKNPLDRFISVVAWSISSRRPVTVGVFPFNPILGETHHVSKGNLNVLLEQVSQNPPMSALHATDEKENIETIWYQYITSKFNGTTVEGKPHGKRILKLLNHGETYEMNAPNFFMRLLPSPVNDWVGDVSVRCLETGLVAELCYKTHSLLGFRGSGRSLKGKIIDSLSKKIRYEINGHWDSTVTLKDTNNGEVRVIYDAKEVISGLKAPIVKDPGSLWPTESAVIWREATQAILSKDWEKAKEAKKAVEERAPKGEAWAPKHFTMSPSKEGGWDCLPIQKWVPPAAIITS